MALFAQYAMAASCEALEDAAWHPKSEEDLEATVRTHSLLYQDLYLTGNRVSISDPE